MKKSLAHAVLTTAMAAGMALGAGGVANAAHCVEGDSPGFSYFGQTGNEETPADNARTCRNGSATTDPIDPSDNAPGKNR